MDLQKLHDDLGRDMVHGRAFIADEDGASYVMNKEGEAVSAMNTATLRRDEWEKLDEALEDVKKQPLDFNAWLVSNGLTSSLPNALGTTILTYETVTDMSEAVMDMDGAGKSEDETVVFGERSMPVPIIYKDFTLSLRRIMSSRTRGQDLPTIQLTKTAEKINEKVEDTALLGNYTFAGATLYGLLTFPFRSTGGTGKEKWDNTDKTGKQILADVQSMITTMKAKNIYGEYSLLISEDYSEKMDMDYSDTKGSNTIRERILKLPRITEIVEISRMSDDTVVLVQKSKSTIELVTGLEPTVYQESTNKGYRESFRISTIKVPRLKADSNSVCGIVHWTLTDA